MRLRQGTFIAVALTILLAGGMGNKPGFALFLPAYRAGKDPAFGSVPVATIIQDVLSLIIYFAIAQITV